MGTTFELSQLSQQQHNGEKKEIESMTCHLAATLSKATYIRLPKVALTC